MEFHSLQLWEVWLRHSNNPMWSRQQSIFSPCIGHPNTCTLLLHRVSDQLSRSCSRRTNQLGIFAEVSWLSRERGAEIFQPQKMPFILLQCVRIHWGNSGEISHLSFHANDRRCRLLHSVVPSILLVPFQIITIGCQYQMAMIFWCQWSVSEFGTKYLCGVEFHCRAYLLNILTIQLWKWDVSKQIL